ncbi:hypothetical protein [Segatella oris]|uniref:hypothetical protein n=1 Tax=Segatella oris TaxID=28135 RepID=UPI001584BD09|nr:hypothetical protein [Segatella oris]
MSGKYEKSRFVGVRRTKIGEKRLSSTGENQKSAKNGFLPRGKIRNHQKSVFPHEGKQEISEKRLSSTGENQKSAKNGFPPRGKIKKRCWLHFLLLRKTKNPESLTKQLSGVSSHFTYSLSVSIDLAIVIFSSSSLWR